MNDNFPHPEWSYNTNIYEVNIRQYTSEGTFEAFEKHLPRLRDMGVEILWFMPITPISFKDRKGTLGSYYAVQNYTEINPEFGSLKDFNNLVYNAHSLGFKVIIDWVANHTGNDNVWIDLHPDFFVYNEESKEIIHPGGWEDVVKLNYDNQDMQDAMIEAMKFWVTSADIDGFRCDMAHLVSLEFWKKTKAELDKVKTHLFWLAECEESHYHEVFDATYTWHWMHKTEDYFKQNQYFVSGLFDVLLHYNASFARDAFRVYFTSNHDENSWNGTEYEKYGDAARLLSVFSCTWNGIPMIYSGQELPNYKRLKFFDKDEIEWKEQNELHEFYKTLLTLRKTNNALRAGDPVVTTAKISTSYEEKAIVFLRNADDHSVLVILNFSPQKYDIEIKNVTGKFKDIYSSQAFNSQVNSFLSIEPWGYFVFEKIG